MPIYIPSGTPAPRPNTIARGSLWTTSNGTMMVYNGVLWIPVTVVQTEVEPMAEFKVTHKTRNVNSKALLKQFTDTFRDIAGQFIMQHRVGLRYTFDYTNLVEFLDVYCQDQIEQNTITTYDVVGDTRNNDPKDMDDGKMLISVKFQQFNCLNITQIDYYLEKV